VQPDKGGLISEDPKSRAGKRGLSFPAELVPELRNHLDRYAERGRHGLVFVGPKGGKLRRSNFSKIWSKAAASAGVPGAHFHDLRDTGGTLAATEGATTRELMARLGHSSPRAALIYQHATKQRDNPFRLRPFTLADIEAVREASQDPHIPLITTVPATFTEDQGRRFIERQWDRAAQGTGYSFAIADADTDRGVGQIGLWLKDVGEGRASIGYWVVRSARGHRAAASALQALALWALHDLQVPRLELHVEPWNLASITTAERAGFQREGLLRSWQEVGGARKDMYMYARLPGDPVH
jgi:RimJ/RimL family protein N-acetyltransferase